MRKIRILIVDDAVVVRRMLADIITTDPELEVVGTAANGRIALNKLPHLKPDAMILDLDMPEMNGLETLDAVRKQDTGLPIIAFSTLTERGAAKTLEALSRGATDYVTKPSTMRGAQSAAETIRRELIPKIKAFTRHRAKTGLRPTLRSPAPPQQTSIRRPRARPANWSGAPRLGLGKFHILAIGTSTGGPNALAELIPRLAPNLPVPIVIVQHMPPIFTRILAERLTAASPFKVEEGRQGMIVQPGHAYLAPGDYHMTLHRGPNKSVVIKTNQGPPEHSCRPAVDVMFRSVAETYGSRTLAVVLTGMGKDGAMGSRKIKQAGGIIFAQDEQSSVVWGMPGFVVKEGLAEKVMGLGPMADEISRRICAND